MNVYSSCYCFLDFIKVNIEISAQGLAFSVLIWC